MTNITEVIHDYIKNSNKLYPDLTNTTWAYITPNQIQFSLYNKWIEYYCLTIQIDNTNIKIRTFKPYRFWLATNGKTDTIDLHDPQFITKLDSHIDHTRKKYTHPTWLRILTIKLLDAL